MWWCREDERCRADVIDVDGYLHVYVEPFKLSHIYPILQRAHTAEPLTCPILALGSEQDARVPAEETKEWAKFTVADFEYRIFPGGHFFLKPLEKEVIAHISSVAFGKDPVGHTAHAMPGFILFDPNAKN